MRKASSDLREQLPAMGTGAFTLCRYSCRGKRLLESTTGRLRRAAEPSTAVDHPAEHTLEASFQLDRARTRQLLKEAHRAYYTQINDLLLAALSQALTALTGHKVHHIVLEGH